MRECGRFAREDFMFLDPLVTDKDVVEEGEAEIVDEQLVEGAHVDVGAIALDLSYSFLYQFLIL
ncbi:UNVERIFIED_CONTAM: hypothetical protein Sangu_2241600 [Sesamum angustifolium]|uniref:Uncharacterized protein n=1 Tax=Sesamum angustifolium TaxID=2727405 RepID=A0AAW2L678_9LAMI